MGVSMLEIVGFSRKKGYVLNCDNTDT